MITAITQRIKDLTTDLGKPIFIDVKTASDVINAMSEPLNASPIAFVVPLEELPGSNNRMMGPALQTVKETVGIIIGIRSVGNSDNDNERLKDIRLQLKKSLFGWAPTTEHSTLLLGRSNMQQLQNGQLFWIDRFTTEHDEEASQ